MRLTVCLQLLLLPLLFWLYSTCISESYMQEPSSPWYGSSVKEVRAVSRLLSPWLRVTIVYGHHLYICRAVHLVMKQCEQIAPYILVKILGLPSVKINGRNLCLMWINEPYLSFPLKSWDAELKGNKVGSRRTPRINQLHVRLFIKVVLRTVNW